MKSGPSADPSMEQILADIRERIAADICEDNVAAGVRQGEAQPTTAPAARPAAPAAPQPARSASDAAGPDRVVELRPRPAVEPSAPSESPASAATVPEPEGRSPQAPEPRFGFTMRREAGSEAPKPATPNTASEARSPTPRASATAAATPQAVVPEAPILSVEADASVSRAFNNLADTLLSNEARTLEDLVREMLRPMLKTWLDSNLPPLVERLVRQEIERVARGQRGV